MKKDELGYITQLSFYEAYNYVLSHLNPNDKSVDRLNLFTAICRLKKGDFPRLVVEEYKYQDIKWVTYKVQYFIEKHFYEQEFRSLTEASEFKKSVEEKYYGVF